MGYNPISDRIISVRLQGRSIKTTVFQVYAPTAESDEDAHYNFYGRLQDAVDLTPNGDVIVIMGNFNAKVGNSKDSSAMGEHGLGVKNEAGNKLLKFNERNGQIVVTHSFPSLKGGYTLGQVQTGNTAIISTTF